ncbi:hypothetical protein [Mesorhizobium sp. M7A.F.Ca.US.010.02.1.1]|nr:hypothetical protein [Mesorhizobium sp. M7A.F.Ca.US.010.02.1.1]
MVQCFKGWAIAATRAMAVELAPFGIRVVATIPSLCHSACLTAGG